MKYLFHRYATQSTSAEVSVPRLPERYTCVLWKPSLCRLVPRGLPLWPFAVLWLVHRLRLFANGDYCMFLVYDGKKCVHRTCVFPKFFRFPFMAKDDLQISSTWTDPAYRGQGLAVFALQTIVGTLGRSGRRFWYITRQANVASRRVAEKSGFALIATGTRSNFLGLRILGKFSLDAPSRQNAPNGNGSASGNAGESHAPLNVWLVTIGEPVPVGDGKGDRLHRTGAFAQFLAGRGHRVTWWTSTFNHSRKKHWFDEDARLRPSDRLEIMLMHGPGYRTNTSLARIYDHYLIGRKFKALIRGEAPPDVIVAALPSIELCRVSADYGRRRGIPVVIDIRDLWPDVFARVVYAPLRLAAKIGLYPLYRTTRLALRRATGIFGVSEGYLDWGLQYAARPRGPRDAVFPLGYRRAVVEEQAVADAGAELLQQGVDPEKILCWFIGMFGRTYGLRTVVDAARILKSQGKHDVQFVLSGRGDQYDELVQRAKGLDNVVFTGWVGEAHIAYLLRAAGVGLMAYADKAPQGLPNKLYEYMSAGLPIVSSLRGETESLLRCHQCGVTYEANSAASLAQAISSLVEDDARRKEMGRRGKQLFEDRFCMEDIYENMAVHLEKLAREAATARASQGDVQE